MEIINFKRGFFEARNYLQCKPAVSDAFLVLTALARCYLEPRNSHFGPSGSCFLQPLSLHPLFLLALCQNPTRPHTLIQTRLKFQTYQISVWHSHRKISYSSIFKAELLDTTFFRFYVPGICSIGNSSWLTPWFRKIDFLGKCSCEPLGLTCKKHVVFQNLW